MEKLVWAVNGNEYRLKTPYGVAIIIENRDDIGDKNAVGARFSYSTRFEHIDAKITEPQPVGWVRF